MTVHSAKIGDIVIGSYEDELEALALGSCIALVIYDDTVKMAAMAHILLPEKLHTDKDDRLGKYADTAVPELIRMLTTKGAKRERLVAKLAGGARMFELTGKNRTLDVGKRNSEMVQSLLKENNIPILAMDVEGKIGRTVSFNIDSNVLTIKTGLSRVIKQI